jgi:hypothetical protein
VKSGSIPQRAHESQASLYLFGIVHAQRGFDHAEDFRPAARREAEEDWGK